MGVAAAYRMSMAGAILGGDFLGEKRSPLPPLFFPSSILKASHTGEG